MISLGVTGFFFAPMAKIVFLFQAKNMGKRSASKFQIKDYLLIFIKGYRAYIVYIMIWKVKSSSLPSRLKIWINFIHFFKDLVFNL
jgi:hypothetical protein